MSLFNRIISALTGESTYSDNRGYKRNTMSGKLVSRWAFLHHSNESWNPEEVVRHRNRDKQDNSFNNLYVFKDKKSHDRVHRKDLKETGKW